MRKVFIGLLFINIIVLTACNFGNPAGIMKEWDALLNEVGIQTENMLLPEESDDVEVTSITYEYRLDDHAGSILAAFLLHNELIQYEAGPKSAETNVESLFEDTNEIEELEIADMQIYYVKDEENDDLQLIMEQKDIIYNFHLFGVLPKDEKALIHQLVEVVSSKESTTSIFKEAREEVMEKANIFSFGEDPVHAVRLVRTEGNIEVQLDFTHQETYEMTYRIGMNDMTWDYDDEEYEKTTLTHDHRAIDKFMKKPDAPYEFLADITYRFELEGRHYEFQVHTKDKESFADTIIFDIFDRMRS